MPEALLKAGWGFHERARPDPQRDQLDKERAAIGGLRRMRDCLNKIAPGDGDCGIVASFQNLFKDEPDIRRVHGRLTGACTDAVSEEVEKKLAMTLGAPLGCDDIRTGTEAGKCGEVRSTLLGAWRRRANDPDGQPEGWLSDGGPLGILHHPRRSRDLSAPR